jgi:hypothetical protein
MIGQYLSNNSKKRHSVILPKILDLNRPLVGTKKFFGITSNVSKGYRKRFSDAYKKNKLQKPSEKLRDESNDIN